MEKEWTCNSFLSMAETLENIKTSFLFEMDEAGISPIAEQHYLSSIYHLKLAICALKIAHLHQIKGE